MDEEKPSQSVLQGVVRDALNSEALNDTLLKAAQLELRAKTTFWELKNKKAAFEAQKAEKECEKATAENFITLLNKNTAIGEYNRATGKNIPLIHLPDM